LITDKVFKIYHLCILKFDHLNYKSLQIPLLQAESRSSLSVLKSSKRQLSNNMPLTETAHDSGSSSAEAHTDSSQSLGKRRRSTAR